MIVRIKKSIIETITINIKSVGWAIIRNMARSDWIEFLNWEENAFVAGSNILKKFLNFITYMVDRKDMNGSGDVKTGIRMIFSFYAQTVTPFFI